MKALSIKQPYAELILQGKKKIELRKWNTNFRGEFLIHASKIPDLEAEIVLYCRGGLRSLLAADALQKMGYKQIFSLAGGIYNWVEQGQVIEGRLMLAEEQKQLAEQNTGVNTSN